MIVVPQLPYLCSIVLEVCFGEPLKYAIHVLFIYTLFIYTLFIYTFIYTLFIYTLCLA